jgi:hypothetical protein
MLTVLETDEFFEKAAGLFSPQEKDDFGCLPVFVPRIRGCYSRFWGAEEITVAIQRTGEKWRCQSHLLFL